MTQEKKTVVLFGAGTVAKRDADLLQSVLPPDQPIALVRHGVKLPKYEAKRREAEARKKNPSLSSQEIETATTWQLHDPVDSRTEELQELLRQHPSRFSLYLAMGKDLEGRITRMQQNTLPVVGVVYEREKFDREPFRDDQLKKTLRQLTNEEVAFAIDASETGIDERNVAEIYGPRKWRFCLNGGADGTLVDHRYFAGILGTRAEYYAEQYAKKNAMIVSCNTHAVVTILALIKNTIFPAPDENHTRYQQRIEEYVKTFIRSIDITFLRRDEDPHVGKPLPRFVELKPSEKHVLEMYTLLPELEGKIGITTTKMPYSYFHVVDLKVHFHSPIQDMWIDHIRTAIAKHPRAILSDGGVDQEKTILAAGWANIRDGDIPFPVYNVRKVSNYSIGILGLTPQRGIVAPSTADLTLLCLDYAHTLHEAFIRTNAQGVYRGVPLRDIKGGVQDNLLQFKARRENPRNSQRVDDYLGIDEK